MSIEPNALAPNAKPKARLAMRIIALIAVLAGSIYGFSVYRHNADFEATDDAQVDADIVQISAQIPGTIKAVFVHDDEAVVAGQLLAQLSPTRYKLAVDQARANLAVAEADANAAGIEVRLTAATGKAEEMQALGGLNQANGGVALAETGITHAQADVNSAKVAEKISANESASARIELESAKLSAQRSAQQTLAANAALDAARSLVGSSATAVSSARTKLEISTQELRRAADLLAQGAISGRQLETFQNTEADAKASLDAANQQHDSALASVRQRQADLESAKVGERTASAAIRDAELKAQSATYRQSSSKSSTSAYASALNGAQRNLSVAAGRKIQSQGVVATSRTDAERVNLKRAATSQALAHVAQARAQLAQSELDLQHCRIVAPFSGHVGKKLVLPGTVVQAGSPVMSVINVNTVHITANFKETQVARLKAGQVVMIDVDGLPTHEFHGTVVTTSPATGAAFALLPPDNANGNFVKVVQRVPVNIALDPDDRETFLHVGMSASVKVKVR